MTDTNPPELYWLDGEYERIICPRGDGRYIAAYIEGPVWDSVPEDAVRLVPQTEVDGAGEGLTIAEEELAENEGISRVLRQQRDRAFGEIDRLQRGRDAQTRLAAGLAEERNEAWRKLYAAEAELARLREHAIQLPEDWRQQIRKVRNGAVNSGQIQRVEAMIESWRPATHPTPRLEVDGEAGAWYIRVRDEPVARTTEQEGTVNVDWTQDGRMVGVELLPATHPTPQVEQATGSRPLLDLSHYTLADGHCGCGEPMADRDEWKRHRQNVLMGMINGRVANEPGVLGVDQPNPSAIRIGPGTIPSVRCSACFTRTPVSWHKQGPRVPEHSVDGVYCTGSGTPIDESVFDTHPPTPSDLQASPTLGASDVGGSGATSNGEGGNVGASELTSPAGNLNSDPGNASQLESAGPALETSEPRKEEQ